jgi:hypothetical protein
MSSRKVGPQLLSEHEPRQPAHPLGKFHPPPLPREAPPPRATRERPRRESNDRFSLHPPYFQGGRCDDSATADASSRCVDKII